MKHLRLFEAFEDIDSICKKYNIVNYTINNDGSVDVDGDVNLRNKGLTKLPLKFGSVTGNFYCHRNRLTTLEGAPSYVGGDLYCNNNKLTSLEGCPDHVGGDFNCSNNKLASLEGGPIHVGAGFYCTYTPIYSIYKLFPNYKAFMNSLDYGYLRGTDIVKTRFEEACEESGIRMPEKIEGYNYI